MNCTNGNIVVADKVTIPAFGSEWVGEYFMLSYEGPDIKNSLNAIPIYNDLAATAECACKTNVAKSMRFGELDTCIELSIQAGVETIKSAVV